MEIRITTSESENYISIHIEQLKNTSFSWEQLQSIKDKLFPNTPFFEIYPPKNLIINKANERHLVYFKKSLDMNYTLHDLFELADIEHYTMYIHLVPNQTFRPVLLLQSLKLIK